MKLIQENINRTQKLIFDYQKAITDITGDLKLNGGTKSFQQCENLYKTVRMHEMSIALLDDDLIKFRKEYDVFINTHVQGQLFDLQGNPAIA